MLQRLGPSVLRAGETSPDAALFPSKLEFNPPAHGTWNIVHIGMLVPEAHQIYVCALNCMRGVVLTAAEMGAQDRFSCVVLREEDITRGTVEQVTLDGIRDVLRKLEARHALPPCVIVFPVCTHLFIGVPMNRVYAQLEEEFPTIDFVRAFMDPISKRRLIPDKRLRKVMYDPLPPCEPHDDIVALLGSEFAPDEDCDLRLLLAAGGKKLVSIHDCATYEEFLGLSRAATFVCTFPSGLWGAEKTAERLGRRCIYIPGSFSYETERRSKGMNGFSFYAASDIVLKELKETLSAIDEDTVEKYLDMLENADKVFFVGVGRVLLSLEAIARRIGHKGTATTKAVYYHVTEKQRQKDEEKMAQIKLL